MSDEQRSSTLDFIVQFSCLVLLCGSLGVLYYALQQRSNKYVTAVAATSMPKAGLSVPRSTMPALKPLTGHTKPPLLPANTMVQLTCTIHDRTEQPITCYVVNDADNQPFLVTLASRLTRSEWEGIRHISFVPKQSPFRSLKLQPDWLGTFTHDNHPNLLAKPDLANDLAWWKLPDQVKARLPLRSRLSEESSPVWIKSTAHSWLKGRIASDSDKAISITMIDRIETEKLLGSIIVNEAGEIVGTVLGGNDLIVTGASSVGLLKKFKETIPTH